MTGLFLGLLALAWLAVFAPAVVRARRENPLSSSKRFRASLHTMSPRGGRYLLMPRGDGRPATSYRRALLERRKLSRRRKFFAFLLGTVIASALNALLGGPGGAELHLVADALFALYVVHLIEARRRRVERARKVHRLRRVRPSRRFQFNEPMVARRRA